MSEPCKQEGAIGALGATVKGVQDVLEKIEEAQERFISILEKIAQQGEKINHLEQGHDILFERIRKIEINTAEDRVKVGGIMAAISVVISGVTAWVTGHFKGH